MDGRTMRLLVESVRDNVLPLTSRCGLGCFFCSNRFNPPGVEVAGMRDLTMDTLRDLLPLLDPGGVLVLGESATRLREGDPLLHPHFGSLMRAIREAYPGMGIRITTGGTRLDGDLMITLSELGHVELVLSLNMVSPHLRSRYLGDPDPEGSLIRLRELEGVDLPLHGSLVAFPGLTGEGEIRSTVAFLEELGAHTVRILWPGFTRASPPGLGGLIPGRQELGELVGALGSEFDLPVLLEPPLIRDPVPRVAGVVRGTPAWRAGVRAGDELVEIDGSRPRTRVEAHRLLVRGLRAATGAAGGVKVVCGNREGPGEIQLPVGTGAATGFYRAGGIIMDRDLDPEALHPVREVAETPGTRGLVLSSRPAVRMLRAFGDRFAAETACERLVFRGVENAFFGGNILSAGLLTVGDLNRALRGEDREGTGRVERWDHVFIPGWAFDSRGRDLTGRSVRDLAVPDDCRVHCI